MGLFRRAPTPQPRPSADLAPRARDGTYASSTTSSASSSDATSSGSSGQYYARFPLPPSGSAHPALAGAAQQKYAIPATSSTSNPKKKGVAAGLMQSSTVATPAAAPAAPTAASPWAGYIEPERLNADSGKRFLLSSSKKAREKQRLQEAEELETYFPMGKIELEKLDLRIPTPSPSVRAERTGSSDAGTGNKDTDAFPFGAPVSHELGEDGQPRAQRQLAGSWIAVASRQEQMQQAQAQSNAHAVNVVKSGSDFARFSVGNMLDLVDQKMRAEEEAGQAQRQRPPQPIIFDGPAVTSTPARHPSPAFNPSASTSSSSSISSPAQVRNLSSSTSSRISNAASFSTSASCASTASSSRPPKSSQDDLEILSPSPRNLSHARRQSGRPARSSISSLASQASTLRDEVLDLLELARSRTSSERSRTTSANGVLTRKSEDSNGGMRARPSFESLSGALKKAVGPGARVPSPSPGMSGPSIAVADAGHNAGGGGRPAIPARPAHTRKRSMSVPSAMHIPGWAAAATAAGGSPFARQVTVHNRMNGQPRAYDESFFSSPRPPVAPRLQTHVESAETAAESPAAMGSTLAPASTRIQLKRVPSSTRDCQSASRPAAPAGASNGQDGGAQRTAAGHPGARNALQHQAQFARFLHAPHTPLAGRAEMEHPHSAPLDSNEGRHFARSPSPSPASSNSLSPTDHRTQGSERARSNSDASVVDPFPVPRRPAKSRDAKKPTEPERESELFDRSLSPEPEPLRITKLRRHGADETLSSGSSRSASPSPSPSPSHTPTARSPLTPVGPPISIRQERRAVAAPAPRGHLAAVATGLPVLVSSSGGIGPPPRSPLPLPPPPSEPLPQPPQQQPMPRAAPTLRPAVSMHALRHDHRPKLAPELPRRAVSPSGYSREHRPRPQHPPAQLHTHVMTRLPAAEPRAPMKRSVHPQPPARPPPPPPLSLADFASPVKQNPKMDVRSHSGYAEDDAAHPVAARDYAFPSRSDGTRVPLASQQVHTAHPALSPRKAALYAFAMRSKRGTTDTVDTIASYYAESHSLFEPPELDPVHMQQQHRPQDSSQQHQLSRYPSSSTLSSAASRTHSGSHDGSHETHWSASTAITEVDEEEQEHDEWGRVRVTSKENDGPAGGKSRFGCSRRGPAVQAAVVKSQDEGYLGSPEQQEEERMRGAVEAGGHGGAYDGRARQRINYTVPARRRPSMDHGF